MPLRAVIFDVDGTLIDSVEAHAEAWSRAFAHFGFDIPAAKVRTQIGKGGDQLMPVFLPKNVFDRQGDEIETWRGDLFKHEYLPNLRAFPGVRPLLERVKGSGARVLLASSAKPDELERYAKIADIVDLLDETASKDDANASKPAPDIFEAALKKAKLDPADALVVGDSPYDAQAASKAGTAAIGVLCGGFPEADLRAAGYRAIYRDPEDLLARFEAWYA